MKILFLLGGDHVGLPNRFKLLDLERCVFSEHIVQFHDNMCPFETCHVEELLREDFCNQAHRDGKICSQVVH